MTNDWDDGSVSLIEPFFGDNPTDAAKGHNNKEDLAEALAKAAAQQLGIA